jgi:hypothetical protein
MTQFQLGQLLAVVGKDNLETIDQRRRRRKREGREKYNEIRQNESIIKNAVAPLFLLYILSCFKILLELKLLIQVE